MTGLQQEVFNSINRSEQEFGQIIEPYLKKTVLQEIETWTENECTKFLNNLMVSNARRKTLKQWWDMNPNIENDPVEIQVTLKDLFGI